MAELSVTKLKDPQQHLEKLGGAFGPFGRRKQKREASRKGERELKRR